MCFNSETSLLTFSISAVCFLYLFNRGIQTKNKNDVFLSILTILIGLMQIIEFFLWKNQDCNIINHYFSLLIIFLLFLQGTIINLVYLKLYPGDSFFSTNFVKTTIFIYSIFIIYVLYYLNTFSLCSKPSSNSCRLVWDPFIKLNEKNNLLYIILCIFYFFMFLIIFVNSIYSKNTLFTKYPFRYSFLAITFIIALNYTVLTSHFYKEIYIFLQNGNFYNLFKKYFLLSSSDIFGSVWCFLSVFVGIIGILKI